VKKLDFYIYRAVIGPALLAMAVIVFISVGNEFHEERSRLFVGATFRVTDILYLGLLFLPGLLPYVLPAATLVGSLLGYGRLAERGEITAMRAAGLSLPRLLSPALVLAGSFTALCYLVQEQVQPRAMDRANRFVVEVLPERVTIATLDPGVMHTFGDWRVYFRQRDDRSGILHDVDIVRYEDGAWVYHARWAALALDEAGAALQLNEGHLVTPDNLLLRFDEQTLRVPRRFAKSRADSEKTGLSLSQLHVRERSLAAAREAGEPVDEGLLRKIRVEIAKRWSLPFATFALAMVGAPLSVAGVGGRRGGRMREFSLALVLLVGYYVILEMLRAKELLPLATTIARLWVPNLICFALGALLIYRLGKGH